MNTDFSLVTPGQVYCYAVDRRTTPILLQLTSTTHLRIDGGNTAARCDTPATWRFSATSVDYER